MVPRCKRCVCQNPSTFQCASAPMRVVRHTDPDALHRRGGADGRARRSVGQLLRRMGAYAMKRTPPAAGRARLSRDLRRLRRRDPARRRPAVHGPERSRGGGRLRRRPGARLAGAAGRGRRAGRLRSVRATLAREHRPRALRARAACASTRLPRSPTSPRRRARRASPTKPTCRGCSTGSSRSSSRPGFPDSAERMRTWLPKRVARGDFRIWEDRRTGGVRRIQRCARRISRASRRSTRCPSIAAAAMRRRWWRRSRASFSRAASSGCSSRPTSPIRRRMRSMRGSASWPKPTTTISISSNRDA